MRVHKHAHAQERVRKREKKALRYPGNSSSYTPALQVC